MGYKDLPIENSDVVYWEVENTPSIKNGKIVKNEEKDEEKDGWKKQ